MVFGKEWREGVRSAQGTMALLMIGLSAACAHSVVERDLFEDAGNLVINLGLAAVLLLSTAAALWMAAKRRASRAVVGPLVLACGFMGVAAAFARASYADVSTEVEGLVQDHQDSSEAATILVVGPTGADIRLSGDITQGAARRLAFLLDRYPAIKRIHLTSEGGLADEGLALGDVIAAHELTTFVPDYCVSACTLAFVRGRERYVMAKARLGFHAPYVQGVFGQSFRGDTSDVRRFYLAAGVSPDFVAQALKTPPDDIWLPSEAQLVSAHVATGVVNRYRFPDSNLDGAATEAAAKALILASLPILEGFRSRSTELLDAVALWYLDSYRRGRSEGEDADRLKAFASAATTLTLAEADDPTLLAAARFLHRGLETAAATDPSACVAISEHADLFRAASLLARLDAAAEGAAAAILSAALTHPRSGAAPPRYVAATDVALHTSSSPCAADLQADTTLLRQSPITVATTLRARVAAQTPRALTTLLTLARTSH